MASLRDIRRRIRSVRNVSQITKAMETVAASRLRRAQERVVASRPYVQSLEEVLADLAGATTEGDVPPLLVVMVPTVVVPCDSVTTIPASPFPLTRTRPFTVPGSGVQSKFAATA